MTVILFGLAAAATGRALAESWQPAWQIVPAALLLAVADRFLHYALFEAPLDSLGGLLVAAAVLGLHHGGRVLTMPAPARWCGNIRGSTSRTGRSAGAPDNRDGAG